MAKKIIVIILLIIFGLGTIAGAAGSYYFWQQKQQQKKQVEEKQKKIDELEKKAKELEEKEKAQQEKTDEYTGWKTYVNNDVGYQLKYPADWTVKETDITSETTGELVKYIQIFTPDQKYFLFFGLREKGNTIFNITDRTGIGAGEDSVIGQITVLGTSINVVKHVWDGKTIEYFYTGSNRVGSGSTYVDNSQYEMLASFSKNSELVPEEIDMNNLPEEKIAEKILSSVVLLK